MATETGTLHHLTEAARCVASSRRQTSAVLGILAGTALVSPAWAGVAAVGAVAMVAARPMLAGTAAPFRRRIAGRTGIPAATTGAGADEPRSYVIGTDLKGNEIALSRREVEQGILMLGTTGSGKSENLIGILDGFLAKGTGGLFIDGKGDVALAARMCRHAVHHGREDDVLVLNFMTGGYRAAPDRVSNTFNPYAHASVDDLHHLFMALLDPETQNSPRARSRCSALALRVARVAGWLRDTNLLWLHPGTLRSLFEFGRLAELADESGRNGMPSDVRSDLLSYLTGLEGYNPERGPRQSAGVLQAHAETEGPLARPLGMLSDLYGHIFHTQSPDIVMRDVVSNDRIVTVLLPALEKSGDELASLGRIVLAAMSPLASGTSDGWRAKGRDPFPCVADEIGYYAVDGLWAMASRARESGVCWILAAQDYPALMRLNPVEAERISSGVGTVILGRTEVMESHPHHGGGVLPGAGRGHASWEDATESLGLSALAGWSARDALSTVSQDEVHGFGAGDIIVLREGERIRGRCAYYDHRISRRHRMRLNHLVPFDGANAKDMKEAAR